jgi:hypothetical protein
LIGFVLGNIHFAEALSWTHCGLPLAAQHFLDSLIHVPLHLPIGILLGAEEKTTVLQCRRVSKQPWSKECLEMLSQAGVLADKRSQHTNGAAIFLSNDGCRHVDESLTDKHRPTIGNQSLLRYMLRPVKAAR